MRVKAPVLFFWLGLLAGCATTTSNKNPYQDTFEAAGVRSILILPVLNRSVNVQAATTTLSILPRMLADHGYYVFPVNTVKVVLEHEGLYEAGELYQVAPEKLAEMFDATAVLYTSVEQWDTEYTVFASSTVVNIQFRLLAADGREIWQEQKTVRKSSNSEQSSNQNMGLLGSLVSNAIDAAIQRAFPDFRPLATEAAQSALISGPKRLPLGPLHPSLLTTPDSNTHQATTSSAPASEHEK